MQDSLTSFIDSAQSILILLPERPTFDVVASGLSLYLSLTGKKNVVISCPSPMMVGMNRLVGVDKIVSELGNKNLTIKFKGYDAANIEKVSYDIINGEFNLTVVPKVGFSSPLKEQMDLGFSGVSSDLVILVGGLNDNDFPALHSEEITNAKLLYIGNRSFASSREVFSLAKPGVGVSEVVANLLKDENSTMDSDIATNLLMGIEDVSSNFASNEVTPETFEMFAFLLRNGGRRAAKTKLSPIGFPSGSIPTQPFNQPLKPSQTSRPPDADPLGTSEREQDINPPDDWLQPKIFKGTSVN